jgi:hypothetical protein
MISFQIAFVTYTGVKAVGSVKFNNFPVLTGADHTNLIKTGFWALSGPLKKPSVLTVTN